MPDSFQQKVTSGAVAVPAPGWVNNIAVHIDYTNLLAELF